MSARRTYSEEQIAFVRENIRNMSTRECARAFSERFSTISQTCLRRLMEKNQIRARVTENRHTPVGTERYSNYYQCMMVKVSESRVAGISKDNPEYKKIRNNCWQLKQNAVWEKANGRKLKRREVVVFLDGNRMNYTPANLFAVPLEIAGSIKRMDMESEDPEIYKTALTWGKLYFEMKKQCRDYKKLTLSQDTELEMEV